MPYASVAEFKQLGMKAAALKQTTDDDIQQAIEIASSEVDSYLGARYKLPLTNYGIVLKQKVCDIAAWNLISARGYQPEAGRDPLMERYSRAVGYFADIRSGKMSPPDIVDTTPTQNEFDVAVVSEPLRGYQPGSGTDGGRGGFWG